MNLPDTLFLPLLTAGTFKDEPILKPYRLAGQVTLAPGASTTVTTIQPPSEGKVWFIYNITFGIARVVPALLPISTDQFIITLEHNQIVKTSIASGLESVYNYEWPQWIECRKDIPLQVQVTNNTALTITQDASFSIYECSLDNSSVVRRYLKGFASLFYFFGAYSTKQIKEIITGQYKQPAGGDGGGIPMPPELPEEDCYHAPDGKIIRKGGR